jgi:hypothetical protein
VAPVTNPPVRNRKRFLNRGSLSGARGRKIARPVGGTTLSDMRHLLISTCATLSLAACGPSAVSDAPSSARCLSLTDPSGSSSGLSVSLPSRVSWLFKVDTCGGDPVAGITAAQFEISEDGKRVSAFESQQRVAPKGERFRLWSVVLLDLSGSMLRSGEFPQVQAAAARYLDEALKGGGDGHRVSLMTFDGREAPQVVVPFTSDRAALQAGLDGLSATECRAAADCAGFPDRRTCAGWRCVDDSTNLNGAVVKALGTLEAQLASSDVPWRDGAVVLFTDGTDQAARVTNAAARDAVARSSQHVFTVGLGGEVDEAALRDLGKDGYWPVERSDRLAAAFSEIAGRVSALANRFYVLEYCSPKRSGRHTLQVRATLETPQGPLTGTLSGEFDATGFASGCELLQNP